MAKNKDIVKQEELVAQAPAPAANIPTGLAENITAADLKLPRVALLQALSPQVQEDPNTFKQGTFINTLTNEPLPTPLVVTPVFLFKNVIKWNPREKGGGIIYKTTNFTKEVLKDISWDGDKKPAAQQNINCVCHVKGVDMPLVVVFHDTSFTAGQNLATLTFLSGCAWKYQYELSSHKKSNNKGTYYVLRVKRTGPTPAEDMAQAAHLYEQVKGMAIDTDYSTDDTSATEITEDASPKEF